MSNQVSFPPELEEDKQVDKSFLPPSNDRLDLAPEVEGSMWSSLIANFRDTFGGNKQAPLELTSKPIDTPDPFKEETLFGSLVGNLRDIFAPTKLPPLELTSTPIAVADPMAVKRNPYAIGVAVVLNVIALLVLIYLSRNMIRRVLIPSTIATDSSVAVPLPDAYKAVAPHGGGGGGERAPTPAPKGKLPDISKEQITPPTTHPIDQPKLPVAPTVVLDMKLPQAPALNLGDLKGPNVTVASNGTGSGGGIGTGHGGGVGSGSGAGVGPGSGGGTGGGVYSPGNGVSAPISIYAPEPEFSDEARKAKYEGSVVVSLIVGTDGLAHDVKIVRPLGMGLDEKALEAVRTYKFKPGMKDGKPVPTRVAYEVVFHIF